MLRRLCVVSALFLQPAATFAAAIPAWSPAAPTDESAWTVVGKGEVVDDEILKTKVLELPKAGRWTITSTAGAPETFAVEARVRFHGADIKAPYNGLASLRVGVVARDGRTNPAYSLNVIRSGERNYSITPVIGDANIWSQPPRPHTTLVDAKPTRWTLAVGDRFPLATISPVWDEDFRTAIEADMLSLPKQQDVWRRLRIEVRKDSVRMYHDGLLAFDEPRQARTDGLVTLELTGPARVTGLTVGPVEELDTRFEPVVLDDLVNAAGFVKADTLPVPNAKTVIGDVPFKFPARTEKADHVDVGRSIERYRRSTDANAGDPMTMWPTMGQLDPSRLRVRVPRGAYSKLWLIAASDDEPNSVPLITARFFKPRKGWAIDAMNEGPILTATADSPNVTRLPIKRPDGSAGNLWLVGLDLDIAAQTHELRDEPVYHLELTKEVKGFRAYPDPMYYGYFQAGLPSAVRVFAMTLQRAPLEFNAHGNRPGNTYPYPEQPVWQVDVTNRHAEQRSAMVRFEVTSPYGKTTTTEQDFTVDGRKTITLDMEPKVTDFGLHTVKTTIFDYPPLTEPAHIIYKLPLQSRTGRFVALPPDTRKATAKNSRWGLWYWNKAHDTHPVTEESMQLFRAYGSYVGGHASAEARTPWKLGPTPHLAFRTTPAWALQDPYDPAEYAKYSEECGLYVANLLKKEPDMQYVSMFAEHSVSLRVTHGTPPEAFNKPWYDYTEDEKKSIRSHLISAKAAYEGVKKHAPNVKFLFGHCAPMFSLPFMKEGYPKELFDGYGVDSPQFERMAERPPRAVECNAMYFLNKEMKERGYDKELVHVESYYPPSHPLALGLREAGDSIPRTAVLSLANGTDRFLACWTLDDPEGAWGSQHYGCVGIIERKPELNPKPGATAYATMTAMLDTAQYDGWLPTGSNSAYCVRFKESPTKHIYALWTIRGTRPITLSLKTAKVPPVVLKTMQVLLTDEHGNQKKLDVVDGKVTVELSPTLVWLTTIGPTLETAEVGEAKHDEAPGEHRKLLDDFEKPSFVFTGQADERYAKNSWDMTREPAPYKAEVVPSGKSNAFRVTCDVPTSEPNLTSRYGVFAPPQPIAIPGKARALGMWITGNSNWGRVVYEIVDAKGEIFQSIGSKDQWNCDDSHSWSYFNFDGRRYVEFPLPNHSPGDDYREQDTVWWNNSAEGIVDLPVSLSKIIVEMPTHQIYVDQIVPVKSLTVEFDDLTAVYENAVNMTDEPVKVQRAAAGMFSKPAGSTEGLPNPIADLLANGKGPATKIERFYAPEQFNDGTRIHTAIAPVAVAKEYQVWVSAYQDGRGAMPMMKTPLTEPLVNRLRPGIPLYFFVTYTAEDGSMSKPSAVATITLKDEFLQK